MEPTWSIFKKLRAENFSYPKLDLTNKMLSKNYHTSIHIIVTILWYESIGQHC